MSFIEISIKVHKNFNFDTTEFGGMVFFFITLEGLILGCGSQNQVPQMGFYQTFFLNSRSTQYLAFIVDVI
jgi:hypothetical protein